MFTAVCNTVSPLLQSAALADHSLLLKFAATCHLKCTLALAWHGIVLLLHKWLHCTCTAAAYISMLSGPSLVLRLLYAGKVRHLFRAMHL
jgi:hypothetical protein